VGLLRVAELDARTTRFFKLLETVLGWRDEVSPILSTVRLCVVGSLGVQSWYCLTGLCFQHVVLCFRFKLLSQI
jgi:hypothetical protein